MKVLTIELDHLTLPVALVRTLFDPSVRSGFCSCRLPMVRSNTADCMNLSVLDNRQLELETSARAHQTDRMQSYQAPVG